MTNEASSGGSEYSGYVMVRADVRSDARVLASFNIGAVGDARRPQQDVVETKTETLPGGHWMKITPVRPLDFGEYVLMEIVSDNAVNSAVWDFGVHPVAQENRDVIKPRAEEAGATGAEKAVAGDCILIPVPVAPARAAQWMPSYTSRYGG